MKNSGNLNSPEWCDIIFEGKNKSYGAFELRQSSTKRHLVAFAVVVLFAIIVSCLPSIISTITAATSKHADAGITDVYSVVEVDNKVAEAEIIKPEIPEPPQYVKMTKFVPPTIVNDDQASDQSEMVSMEEVATGKDAIGSFNVEEGSTSENAVRKEFEQQVTEGTGGGAAKQPEIFISAEFMPQFPGGDSEMYRFIGDHLKYPVIDQEMGVQGRVIVRFVVSKTGEIGSLELVKGISPTCDKEAMRVIKSMPKWIPGKQQGVPVPVYFTMPIVFKLKQ